MAAYLLSLKQTKVCDVTGSWYLFHNCWSNKLC
jgi:hypothetical protein